jgi:hypothetical protein
MFQLLLFAQTLTFFEGFVLLVSLFVCFVSYILMGTIVSRCVSVGEAKGTHILCVGSNPETTSQAFIRGYLPEVGCLYMSQISACFDDLRSVKVSGEGVLIELELDGRLAIGIFHELRGGTSDSRNGRHVGTQ